MTGALIGLHSDTTLASFSSYKLFFWTLATFSAEAAIFTFSISDIIQPEQHPFNHLKSAIFLFAGLVPLPLMWNMSVGAVIKCLKNRGRFCWTDDEMLFFALKKVPIKLTDYAGANIATAIDGRSARGDAPAIVLESVLPATTDFSCQVLLISGSKYDFADRVNAMLESTRHTGLSQ